MAGKNTDPRLRQVGGSHYKDCAIQPSDYIVANDLGWYEGNAVKYITRHKKKGGRESILKAIHYLELLLEREYPNESLPSSDADVLDRRLDAGMGGLGLVSPTSIRLRDLPEES